MKRETEGEGEGEGDGMESGATVVGLVSRLYTFWVLLFQMALVYCCVLSFLYRVPFTCSTLYARDCAGTITIMYTFMIVIVLQNI